MTNNAFLHRLSEGRILVSDGGLGTMLQAKGLEFGACPELWNEDRPEDVLAVHRAYFEAGADMVSTNSFGGSRHKLRQFGAEDKVGLLNRRAAEIARQAAGTTGLVSGSIGPVGELLEPYGELTEDEARQCYTEQSDALAEGGADLILIETFYDLNELQIAVECAKLTGKPVACTMTFDMGGRTMMGTTPEQAWEAASGWGLAAFGSNCGFGPEEMLSVIRKIHNAGCPAVIAQPNAGLPETRADGSLVYHETPDAFCRFTKDFLDAGCRILGGCCGSTPEHIRHLKMHLAQLGV